MQATYEETLANFMKAEEIAPGAWKCNQLWIAKTLVKLNRKDEAKLWLETYGNDGGGKEKEIQNNYVT